MKSSIHLLGATAALGLVIGGPAVAAQQGQSQQQAQGQPQAVQQAQSMRGGAAQASPAIVRQVQQALKDAGHDAGPVDGAWGEETQQALRDYQQANNLEPTGNINQRTLSSLGIETSDFAAGEFPQAGAKQGGASPQGQQQAEPQGQGAPMHVSPAVVRQVQQALKDAGHDAGSVDGTWGEQTQQALRDYQQANNLEPTGNINQRTLSSLGIDTSDFAAGEFPQGGGQQGGGAQRSEQQDRPQ